MCSTISGPIPSWIRHHCMAKRQCMQVIADNMLHPTLDCLLSWSLLYNSMVNKTAQCACLTTKSLVAQCHAISAGRADVIDKTTRTAFGQRRARVRLKFSSGNGESPVKILFLCYHRNLIEIHLRVNNDSPNSNIPNKYRNAQDKKKQLLLKMTCQGHASKSGFSCPFRCNDSSPNSRSLRRFHPFFEAVGCQSFHFGSSQRAQWNDFHVSMFPTPIRGNGATTIQQWKSKRGKHVKKNVPEKFPAGIWQPFDGGPLNCNLIWRLRVQTCSLQCWALFYEKGIQVKLLCWSRDID